MIADELENLRAQIAQLALQPAADSGPAWLKIRRAVDDFAHRVKTHSTPETLATLPQLAEIIQDLDRVIDDLQSQKQSKVN